MADDSKVTLGHTYFRTETTLSSAETDLAKAIKSVGDNPTDQPSQATLLKLQYQMQVFSFFAEFTSTVTKKVGDTFSGIVRNF